MCELHEQQYNDYLVKLRIETTPVSPVWSAQLHRVRKTEQHLVAQGRYEEANIQKEKAQEMERVEEHSWQMKRDEKIKTLETRFLQKQKDELMKQKKKIETWRRDLVTKMNDEEMKLNKRFNDTKNSSLSQNQVMTRRHERYNAAPHLRPLVHSPKTSPRTAKTNLRCREYSSALQGSARGAYGAQSRG